MVDQSDNPQWTLRRIAVGVVVLMVAVGAGAWFGLSWLNQRDVDQQHLCAGQESVKGPGFQLHRTDDRSQCVGWTVDQPAAFGSPDPRIGAVVKLIVAENARVRDHAAQYIRVAVLLPLPVGDAKPALLPDAAYHSLQGAYAAQLQANNSAVLGDTALQIQLVVANEGTRQEQWSDDAVVPALGGLKNDSQHPLVAVTGMGISIPATTNAATALQTLGLPVIGSVVTSDDMTAPALFKVAPSNHEYAQALRAFLTSQASQPDSPVPANYTAYLVFDRNKADNYVQSLYTAITDTFTTLSLSDRSRGFDGSLDSTTTLFEQHVSDICSLKPQVIFFAGRDRDLKLLVDALRSRARCTQGQVTPLLIATGSTGLNMDTGGLDQAKIGILDASATDPAGWQTGGSDSPSDYTAFHTLFTDGATGNLHYPESDLDDGYAIMHRDGVAAAVRSARWNFSARVAAGGQGSTSAVPMPTATDVHNSLFSIRTDPIHGASGTFFFQEKPPNDLWPIGKPVPVIRVGAVAGSLPAPATTYLTRCQVRSNPNKPDDYHVRDCTDGP